MTQSKENTVKNAVSNTGVLIRFVTRPSRPQDTGGRNCGNEAKGLH